MSRGRKRGRKSTQAPKKGIFFVHTKEAELLDVLERRGVLVGEVHAACQALKQLVQQALLVRNILLVHQELQNGRQPLEREKPRRCHVLVLGIIFGMVVVRIVLCAVIDIAADTAALDPVPARACVMSISSVYSHERIGSEMASTTTRRREDGKQNACGAAC